MNAESYPISAIFAGDISCPIGSVIVEVVGLQDVHIAPQPYVDGAVLTYVAANDDLEWLPDDDVFNSSNTYFVSLTAGDVLVWNGSDWTNAPLPPFLATPASPLSTDPGTPGEIAYDTGYIYVCQASGNWGRAPLTFGY
jgi:hypothetical protein